MTRPRMAVLLPGPGVSHALGPRGREADIDFTRPPRPQASGLLAHVPPSSCFSLLSLPLSTQALLPSPGWAPKPFPLPYPGEEKQGWA